VVTSTTVAPTRVVIGEAREVDATNPCGDPAAVLVDFEVEFAHLATRTGPGG
jgi:hypothetical protein